MVRYWIALFLLSGVLTGGAIAQDAVLRSLETGDDADPWTAVGRLDYSGQSLCTGALIAPDVVLTAAHCLIDEDTGKQIDQKSVEFLAGWRNGRASAYRKVRRWVVHPDYKAGGGVSPQTVRYDLALVELERPIKNTRVTPFEVASKPRRGERVGVVSYGRNREDAPSLQEVCAVLAHQRGVLVTSCSVDFGSSGAPIFSFDEGAARIVSVVSAKSETGKGEPIALGTDLEKPLAELQAQLAKGTQSYKNVVPTASRIAVGEGRGRSGAKFVKP